MLVDDEDVLTQVTAERLDEHAWPNGADRAKRRLWSGYSSLRILTMLVPITIITTFNDGTFAHCFWKVRKMVTA